MSHPLNSTNPGNTALPIFRKEKNGCVLLVECDSDIGHTISLLLNSQGYEVVLASDVTEAYSLIRYKGFEFILFDWFLEEERGLELCRLIRTTNNQIPVFFYTHSSGDRFKQKIETEVQQYSVNHIDKNPVLKVIFQHIKNQEG